ARVASPGRLGPAPPDEPADSLPRAHSIDAYVVSEGGAVVVEDTARDPRFAENPRLASNRIRFYAGVPLRDEDGRILGSFGILHREPRDIGPGEDRKSTRLNSSHVKISYAVFCLKKKK